MILGIIIGAIGGAIGGFIAGVLVYRHNLKRAQEAEANLRAKYEETRGELEGRIEKAKEVIR